ncbi:hypothetical protein pb186bvf_013113 [Paramecium bursaria]
MEEQKQQQINSLNLKFGDIIYLKSFFTNQKGVISGDGIASNKIECVQYFNLNKDSIAKEEDESLQKAVKSKIGNLSFQKCLFRVETAKKYFYQEFQQEDQLLRRATTGANNDLATKIEEEKQENDRLNKVLIGTNIAYGQDVQFIHIYSKCILTLNQSVLAKQNCCRELSLEEAANSYSNFRILASGKGKQVGESLLYGDLIHISNSVLQNWQLGIYKPQSIQQQYLELLNGLEVNASENPQPVKLCPYLDYQTNQEIKNLAIRTRGLQSGDIIRIKNRALGGFISVRRMGFVTSRLKDRILLFKDQENKTFKPHKQHYFNTYDLKSNDTINTLYKIFIDSSESGQQNLNNLWQIQTRQGLKYQKCTYEEHYLFKHVTTGCFLQIQNDRLILTYNGDESDCVFQLKSKRLGNEQIIYGESVRFLNQNITLTAKKNELRTQNRMDKTDLQFGLFTLKSVGDDVGMVANRISSLQTYLLQFYLFLQDWGLQEKQNKLQKTIEYDYFHAFNNQKPLYDEIQQFFQSLDNLRLFLQFEGQTKEQIQQRQQAVLENDIINILFATLQQIHFMIYGDEKYITDDYSKQFIVPDKSPQKIAKSKLDPSERQKNCIVEIYLILQLCVQSSSQTSDFIFTLKICNEMILIFLLKQLKYHRKQVSDLLKETVRYTDMNDESVAIHLEKWIQQLQDVTDNNIEDQTLFIELLSLMMIDQFENPNQVCQDQCRKLLFKPRQQGDQMTPITFGLFESAQPIPYIQFNDFMGRDYQYFPYKNQMFCTFYNRYVDRQLRNYVSTNQIQITKVSFDFFTTQAMKKSNIIMDDDPNKAYHTFFKYEQYVLSILNLYSSLCKGRNYKSIDALKEYVKIDKSYLFLCYKYLQGNQCMKFEKAIMNLLINLEIDIDPLTPISKFINNSFVYEDVMKFEKNKNYSGQLYYEQSISNQLKERFKQDNKDLQIEKEDYLKQYINFVIQRVNEQDHPLRKYVELFTSLEFPAQLKIEDRKVSNKQREIDYNLQSQFQLEYFLSLLNIVRLSVDLGYNDLETNSSIFETLPNIFIALIISQNNDIQKFNDGLDYETNKQLLKQDIQKDENYQRFYNQSQKRSDISAPQVFRQNEWMLQLLIWTTLFKKDDIIYIKVFLEALKILQTLITLKRNLVIQDYLKNSFNGQIKDVQGSQSSRSRGSQRSRMWSKMSPRRVGSGVTLQQPLEIYNDLDKYDYKTLLFECLYVTKGRNKLTEELMNTLVFYFQYPQKLCEEIQSIEFLDNQVEIQYFMLANGNAKDSEWLSPKEAAQIIRKFIKYNKKQERENTIQDLKKSTKQVDIDVEEDAKFKVQQQNCITLKNYLNAIINKFEMVKASDLFAFQNILRNAGVHKVFIELMCSVSNLQSNNDVVYIFRKIIQLFELFCKDNKTNTRELIKYLPDIFTIAYIEQPQATDINYSTINITKLVIQIISVLKGDLQPYIQKIFKSLIYCGNNIDTKLFQQLKAPKASEEIVQFEQLDESKIDNAHNVVFISAIKQYFKILKHFCHTFTKPVYNLSHNKHFMLNYILEHGLIKGLVDPMNFYENIIFPERNQDDYDQDEIILFHQLKLHSSAIRLITECAKLDRLAIQEVQRVLSYEQLKQIILHHKSQYVIKRPYLMCIFELYICKVQEQNHVNETIDTEEIRDILSRVIIPELDSKQISKYLDGLAKLRIDEQGFKHISKQLRDQINSNMSVYDNQMQISENDQILRDPSEFWKYFRKNGIVHFLVYTYDEVREILDDPTRMQDNPISDEFSIIKQNIQNVKKIFTIIEREFRMKKEDLDLDLYRDLITLLEEIIPHREKLQNLERISEFLEQAKKQMLRQSGFEKKLQDQSDNVQRLERPFQRNVKIFLVRYDCTIQELIWYFKNKSKHYKSGFYNIVRLMRLNNKQYLNEQEYEIILNNEGQKIKNALPDQDVGKDVYIERAFIELFGKQSTEVIEQDVSKRKRDSDLFIYIQKFPQFVSKYVNEQLLYVKEKYASISKYVEQEEIEQDEIVEDDAQSEQQEEVNQTELTRDIEITLSEDTQIIMLVLNIQVEHIESIININKLYDFVSTCKLIFLGQEYYLIKISRILLEQSKPTNDEIENIDFGVENVKELIQKRDQFKQLQTQVCFKSQLDEIAFQLLSNTEGQQSTQYEIISLLGTLLEYGNQQVQKKIFDTFQANYKVKNTFLFFLRKFFALNQDDKKKQRLQQTKTNTAEQIRFAIKVLRLLQMLCENINLDFQRFLVIQDDTDQSTNMNIVQETLIYLSNIIQDPFIDKQHIPALIRQGIDTLIEFTTGYKSNKDDICKNQKFFHQIKRQFPYQVFNPKDMDYFKEVNNNDQIEVFKLVRSFNNLILTLVQGNPPLSHLEFVYDVFDIPSQIGMAKRIYEQRISQKLENIRLDQICTQTDKHAKCLDWNCELKFRTDEDDVLIQLGFSVFIICYHLQDRLTGVEYDQLDPFVFEYKELDIKQLIREQLEARHTTIGQIRRQNGSKIQYQMSSVVPFESQQSDLLDVKARLASIHKLNKKMNKKMKENEFFKFYRSYIGRVEVQNRYGHLEKVYFQSPFVTKFITPNVKKHLIYESNRQSDEERTKSLLQNTNFYLAQMEHNQQIQLNYIWRFGANHWRLLKDISFLLCSIIVLLLLLKHDTVVNSKFGSTVNVAPDEYTSPFESFVSYINNIFTIMQLVLNLIIIVFCAAERYPISIRFGQGETNTYKIVCLKKEAGLSVPFIQEQYLHIIGKLEEIFDPKQKTSLLRQIILIFILDFDNFYNLCIFGLTCYAFFDPYIYTVLMLDIIKRSEDLQNIIKSITQNARNLLKFSFLGLVGLILYGVLTYNFFDGPFEIKEPNFLNEDFDEIQLRQQGLFGLSVADVINKGFRDGVGDATDEYYNSVGLTPDSDANLYWGIYFYEFTFFILFNILFTQIIFGVILDTFGELRDARQDLINEIQQKCFVCSLGRNDIDSKGAKGQYYHIYLEHNAYHMLFYIIYIQKKNLNSCNILEQYVKKCIEKQETDFFPKDAIQMQE